MLFILVYMVSHYRGNEQNCRLAITVVTWNQQQLAVERLVLLIRVLEVSALSLCSETGCNI
jgi:hypothetical protein